MAFFTVNYTYDPAKDADAVRPEHREFLRRLEQKGFLRASGPLDTTPQRALLIFEAADADQVKGLIDEDPMYTKGVIQQREILGWNPVIGVFAE